MLLSLQTPTKLLDGVYVYVGTHRKGLDFLLGKEKRMKMCILKWRKLLKMKGHRGLLFQKSQIFDCKEPA